jgi:predicted MFS family arabinose efflux permease
MGLLGGNTYAAPRLAAAMAGVGFGVPLTINCGGLFVTALEMESGWSRTAVSFGPMIAMLYAVLLPFAGARIERWGPWRSGFWGLIALAAGQLALAIAPLQATWFVLAIIWLALAGTMTCNVVFCRAIAPEFTKRTGTAIAILLTGVSLTAAAAQPILAAVIEAFGWRWAMAALGLCSLVFGAIPVGLVMLSVRKVSRQVAPGNALPASAAPPATPSLASPRFWFLSATFAAAAAAIGGFVAQIQPIMLERGFDIVTAASIASVFLALTALGRLCAGVLFDIAPPRFVATAAFALSAFGAVLLMSDLVGPSSFLTVILAVGLIGLSQGAEGDFMALFTLRLFGLLNFTVLFAYLNTVVAIGFALGGLSFAWCFDYFGTYRPAIAGAAILLLAAAIGISRFTVPRVTPDLERNP